ncbi:uncharacterized protein [Atheta coriaria]|uniref:uncharacterized protein n=1 Tax=Dalotia coriaria TaxID=877792 RepID=UPI0031F44E32
MMGKTLPIFIYQLLLIKLLHAAFLSSATTSGLKWVRVNLPQYRKPGETAQLQCDYDLGNDTLYAVKWYKDNEEFYRYVAKERPPASSHNVEGVSVDVSLSDSKRVILRGVTLRSGGLYMCEVSAEAPSFASAKSEARMEVICLPTEDPTITGVESQYQIGGEINLNCTSGESYPASLLHWYINEHQVTSNKALIRYPTVERSEHGLRTAVLGLRFALNSRHFLGGSMRVKCVASLSPLLWSDDRSSVVQNLPIKDHQQELLGEWSTLMLVKSRGQTIQSHLCLVILFVSTLNIILQ